MIKKLNRTHLRRLFIAATALAFVVSLASTLSSDAWADGPRARTAAAKKATAKKSLKRFTPKPVSGVVNINTATQKELEKLPGIGPSKAERIVQYRARKGKFRRVRDLRRVKGIGRKTVQKMSKHLTVTGATTIR